VETRLKERLASCFLDRQPNNVILRVDHLLPRMHERGLVASSTAAASAVAAINSSHHVALVSDSASPEVTLAFGELLADCAYTAGLCVGWLCVHGAAGALLTWQDLTRDPFMKEVWLLLADPSPEAIARVVHQIRGRSEETAWRLIAATSHPTLRAARLSSAERRLLTPVAL
jgi:hypothetical protein